jgi:hypothetical protein
MVSISEKNHQYLLYTTYCIPTFGPPCTYIHTYIHTHIHTYIHTYIHAYIHTYTHTHIQEYKPPSLTISCSPHLSRTHYIMYRPISNIHKTALVKKPFCHFLFYRSFNIYKNFKVRQDSFFNAFTQHYWKLPSFLIWRCKTRIFVPGVASSHKWRSNDSINNAAIFFDVEIKKNIWTQSKQ